MKKLQVALGAVATVVSLWAAGPALAQMNMDQDKMKMDQGKMEMAATPAMTEGEVRKVDKATGKITIKHGEIKHMDMPGMTMVFVAKDKALLDKVKPGDKIGFMVVDENGQMMVTDIQPAK